MSPNTLGRYQIVREIGRSNDVVYEALDASINRRVALKELILPSNLAGVQKRERIERFYREARAAGALSHPNIVTIYEAGEDHGRHFIAMEYLDGQTLRNILDIEGTLSIDKAANITSKVCEALAYAHSKGVIHRDIKPDNIQILSDGRIKITDFGIARIMEEPSITVDGQVFGTPSYMSPEQVAGKPLDPRTDIFSLGVVLFEMLVGRKPFIGDTVVTITYNIMNQDMSVPPGIPAHFERILRRSLAKDPNQRYQSASDMAADLQPEVYKNASMTTQLADPLRTTMSAPNPVFNNQSPGLQQTPPFPQPSPLTQQASADPFAHLKPGTLSHRLSVKPVLSADALYFLKVLLVVILISSVIVGFVWALTAGYQGYQQMAKQEEINRHMQAGKQYFDQKSYQAAISEYTQAINMTRDPEISQAARRNIAVSYMQIADDLYQQGNLVQAVAIYRQAIQVDSGYADAYLRLGIALKGMNNDDEAIAVWNKSAEVGYGSQTAIDAREYIAVLYHERGDYAYNHGDKNLAIDWWRKAIEVSPGTRAGLLAQQKIDQVMK
ncbi:MAG: protein kinase domain-containing protein [Armatimonadota bacterium]